MGPRCGRPAAVHTPTCWNPHVDRSSLIIQTYLSRKAGVLLLASVAMSSKHLYESVVDSESVATHRKGPRRHPRIFFPALFAFCTLIGGLSLYGSQLSVSGPRGNGEFDQRRIQHPPFHAQRILSQCAALKATVGLPEAFSTRNVSDRFEPGTNSTLIRNANIWTGARNGTETVVGDVLLEGGVVKRIGYIPHALLVNVHNLTIVEANGAWVTPGLGEC